MCNIAMGSYFQSDLWFAILNQRNGRSQQFMLDANKKCVEKTNKGQEETLLSPYSSARVRK